MPYHLDPDSPASQKLVKALRHHNLDGVREALAAGAQPNVHLKTWSMTALVFAQRQCPEAVDLLVQAGADLAWDPPVSPGFAETSLPVGSALAARVQKASPEALSEWLDAEPRLREPARLLSALRYAASLDHVNILIGHLPKGPWPLSQKASQELIESLKFRPWSYHVALRDHYPDWLAPSVDISQAGHAALALTRAVTQNNSEAVRGLLGWGADPTRPAMQYEGNASNWITAQQAAVDIGKMELLRLLQPSFDHDVEAWTGLFMRAANLGSARVIRDLWKEAPGTIEQRQAWLLNARCDTTLGRVAKNQTLVEACVRHHKPHQAVGILRCLGKWKLGDTASRTQALDSIIGWAENRPHVRRELTDFVTLAHELVSQGADVHARPQGTSASYPTILERAAAGNHALSAWAEEIQARLTSEALSEALPEANSASRPRVRL